MCLFISSVTPFSGFLSLRLRFHNRILHHVLKSQIVTVTATSFPFLVFLLSGLFFFEHHSPTRIVPGAVVGVEGRERKMGNSNNDLWFPSQTLTPPQHTHTPHPTPAQLFPFTPPSFRRHIATKEKVDSLLSVRLSLTLPTRALYRVSE